MEKEVKNVESVEEEAVDTQEVTEESVKTFTQEEVDKLVQERVNRAVKKAEREAQAKIDEAEKLRKMNAEEKSIPFIFSITDENGDALVLNFPKCSLSPVDVAGETEREDFLEQMQQFNIYAMPLVYKVDDKQFVYHKLDMAEEKNKTQYDLSKLLSQGWYNTETLEACKKEA